MGVPGFFSWLRRKYPQIVDECAKDQGQQEGGREERVCDNLYIDMNHIIHGCSHPRWRDSAYESEIEIFRGIQAYLERLVHTCRPQRLLMIAIDGVAPQAKMCQQRTRRFMSAHTERLRKGIEKEIRREMLAQARNAIIIPPLNSFDGNVITPGTPFMARLAAQLRRWLEYKVASDPGWLSMQVVLSDSNEPGEGEHKIMRFIRHQRACSEYDPNTSHVIYGQDADLILLALLTHEPHFSLLREAGSLEEAVKEMGLDPADWSTAKHQPLQFLNVSTLREYFRFEFKDLVGLSTDPPPAWEASMYDPWQQAEQDLPELAPENENSDNASEARAEGNDAAETAHSADLASSVKSGHSSAEPSIADSKEASSKGYGSARPTGGANSEGRFDFERVLQDFVLLTFLAGNDFLPSIPSLEIYGRPSGLDVLVRTYKDLLPALGGPITNGSIINPDRLKRILSKLAEDEEDAFQRLAMRKARDFQWLAERETEGQGGCAPGYTGPDGSGQWVSMGELGDNDLDSVLGSLGGDGAVQSHVFDLLTATPEELTHELAQRVMKRLEDTLKGSAEADPVKLGNPGHRARLYEQRFGANPGEGVEKMCRKVSHAYAQGLTWVLAYYVHGSVPVPVSNTHAVAIEAAKNQMHGKSKQSSAADSNEGLGATWDWYYPYHYAPLISDLAKHATGGKRNKATIGNEVLSIEDDDWAPLNGPVRPLVQLMAVLPPESARACLPLKLALILEGTRAKGGLEQTSVAAALADMFPADLTSLIDMSGKMFAHTAIVKLPFANVKRLAAAAQQADPNEQELTPADEERNELRAGSIVTHNHHPCATALRLIARQGLSWDKARSKLTAQKRSRWSARPGKRSLSMLRLLVPSVHPEEESTPTSGQHMPVTIAGMDLAGVPTAPFSASLLAGCELPPAVVSEHDWEREQRKFGPPFMAGRGGGRRGGSSFGGGGGGARGFNANGRGKYSARGAGQYSKAAVLTVPRQKAAPIPIRKPSEAPIPPPAWGQRASATRATQDRP
ncbi:TPA: 5'-3' exoribonuclease 2 [Trebouxia sp. C0004]